MYGEGGVGLRGGTFTAKGDASVRAERVVP
jgi:hypothetical protein